MHSECTYICIDVHMHMRTCTHTRACRCVFIGALVRENATLTELNLNTNDTGPDGLTAIINQVRLTSETACY